MRFMRRSSAAPVSPAGSLANQRSASSSSSIWKRNHGSMPDAWATSSTETPARRARLIWKTRSGVGVRSATRRSSGLSLVSRSSARDAPVTQPGRPISSARSPFWNASLNVRPMAIASPTDFICVVRRKSAVGNFSNANRGTFTTT